MAATLENILEVPWMIKHTEHIIQELETYSNKYVYLTVHSIAIYHSQMVEITQISIS
jgi:hypothetical protein